MSEILNAAAQKMAGMRDKLAADLDRKPLSRMLRRDTWPDHERAQFSTFELALAGGTITRPAYESLLQQMLPVYRALEERSEALKDDPIGGQVYFPELSRSAKIAADIDFFVGEGASAQGVELLPITQEYIDRIRTCSPTQFVAQHYNRFLADLSGGFIIGGAIKRAWDLDLDGMRYYQFETIEDPNAFKDVYRTRLDGLPIDTEGKIELIQEVIASYDYNIGITAILAERYLEPAGA